MATSILINGNHGGGALRVSVRNHSGAKQEGRRKRKRTGRSEIKRGKREGESIR
ncbi:NADH-quinone oxidoreductase subunit D [Sesbania bispinosa]|nr:NADH-quinone oxidoreductase subunit D [Sesbania bispinosa]